MNLSYKFRPGKTRVRSTAGKRPYNVRWTVAGKRHDQYFATAALAESFKAELTQAAARGEAFDIDTGLPVSKLRELEEKQNAVTWMMHARQYVLEKWPRLSGSARVSVAEVLVTVSLALLPENGKGRPPEALLSRALRRWAFNAQQRSESVIPDDIKTALDWADKNSPLLAVLGEMKTLRMVLNQCARKQDGKPAAANYLARRRQVLYNVLKYAVIWKRLSSNPLDDPELHWERPSDMETDHEVDPRSVGNPRQVEQMLAAVTYVGRSQGPRFLAFFACMFYGMLRPEEVIGLRVQDCELPDTGWGRLILEKTKPAPGKAWTDSGEVHDDRGLKHRSRKTVRSVPISPKLVRVLRWHIDQFGAGQDGRVFRSVNDNSISPSTYSRVWSTARQIGLAPAQYDSVLLRRPYDLRHAGVTVRLYAGVPERQVAEWAGHSVDVLRRVYSKILDGFDDTWFEKIDKLIGE